MSPATARAMAASAEDHRRAQAIVDSDPVLRTFGAVEWDCLNDDGREWLAIIIREAMALSAEEPVGEVVLFGGSLKEVAWIKGKLPPVGAKLYCRPQTAAARGEGAAHGD